MGCRERHLRRRRTEARPQPGSGTRADLPAQPQARGRPRVRRLWAKQPGRQGSRDSPGEPGSHPRRTHSPAGRLLASPRRWESSAPRSGLVWAGAGRAGVARRRRDRDGAPLAGAATS
jgi:hypothetical protein